MRRLLITAVLLSACALGAGAASGLAGAPGVAAAATPPVTPTATLDDCTTTGATQLHSATFRGDMRATAGTARMAMRFDLLVRHPDDVRFSVLSAPKFGTWDRSIPGVGRFTWGKQVTNLVGPAEYRARVRFRWYDASGRTIVRATLRTPACRQPDQRPNLVVGRPTTQLAEDPGDLRYVVPVRNAGPGDAGAFDVSFSLDRRVRPALPVAGLRAGEVQKVTFTAPRCERGQQLRFEADPADRIDETREQDNAITVDCPA